MSQSLEKWRPPIDEQEEENAWPALDPLIVRILKHQGRLEALNHLAESLNSEVMRNLLAIEDQKLWRITGHKSFADFIDKSDFKFKHSRFYELKSIYEKVDDNAFDLMILAGISVRTQKFILTNNVTFEVGNDQVVIDGTPLDLKDLKAIRAFAENIKTELTVRDRAKKDAEKQHAREIAERDKEINNLKVDLTRDKIEILHADPHSTALANVCFAIAALREEAEKLSALDRHARKDNALEVIAGCLSKLRETYRLSVEFLTELADTTPAEILREGAALATISDSLSRIESDKRNTAELAAKM